MRGGKGDLRMGPAWRKEGERVLAVVAETVPVVPLKVIYGRVENYDAVLRGHCRLDGPAMAFRSIGGGRPRSVI